MNKLLHSDQSGFTIPELLVAVVVFIGLCVGSYYLLRPTDYTPQKRDAQRLLNTAQLTSALIRYDTDNGHLPSAITGSIKVIGSDKTAANLCGDLVPKYLKDIPLDPAWGLETVSGTCAAKNQQYITSYLVSTTNDGKTLVVSAPMAETQFVKILRSVPN